MKSDPHCHDTSVHIMNHPMHNPKIKYAEVCIATSDMLHVCQDNGVMVIEAL